MEYKCSEAADSSLIVSCEDGVCPEPSQWPPCDQIDEAPLKATSVPGILIAGGKRKGYVTFPTKLIIFKRLQATVWRPYGNLPRLVSQRMRVF